MKKAFLLINLGTPNSPDPIDVGHYLTEFLLDKNVIDLPFLIRQFLVRVLIVPKRKFASAKKYKTIWKPEGSPLLLYTESLSKKLDEKVNGFDVFFAMRYGRPSIAKELAKLTNYDQIVVLPLYPQDTKSSFLTAKQEVLKHSKKLGIESKLIFLKPFYKEDFYINSWAQKIKEDIGDSPIDYYLFSYHGIPQHHIPKECAECAEPCSGKAEESQCYRSQCYVTTGLIAKKLGLRPNQFSTSFQSRLGKRPWIRPYTDLVIEDLKVRGIKNLAVFSPSFVVDCLETVQELAIELKEDFENDSKAHKLTFIPCLNDGPVFVDRLGKYIDSLPRD